MDDTLGFSEQEKKPSDDWHLGDTEESVSSVTSKICPHYQDLQVLEKKDFFLDRPQIPATYWERLSFLRSYATSQTRTMFLCVQEEDFRVYLWNYLINVFFKSLPTTYVYAFLSAYVPDTHFFVAKIFPIAHAFIVLQSSDFDLLSESMTTPPIVHILSSRSNIDKKPIQDSALIVTSNAVYYTFRVTLMELIIIFYLYPLGRLVDDMTFFNGVRPTKLRIFTFWAAPVFYMGWIQLFKPLPNWGPKDYTLRQLRKRYDSRFFITSQTSRELSRYLIEKSELNEYKLDVQYESLSRRPSLKPAINLEVEKNK
ncbi:uncharacterized protein LOC125051269 [Pieris napi]|uniref:uncharacterized protein LOC125051269 n=1 Tax=Pieris napi TaxID=78633 RepID=UPI001FB87DDC|nr:uncharacterized protein LOC125051269 [Pieris napi]